MEIFVASMCIFAGYVLGKLFVWQVLAVITAISSAMCVYIHITMKEFVAFVAWICIACFIIVNTSMWITHYIVTEQSWLGELFGNIQLLK